MPARAHVVLACVLATLVPGFVFAQPAAGSNPEIAVIQGDLYRVRDGQQETVFLVTPDGIILGDPLSYDTATWLKSELAERFPGRPVRFVLHTHHHFDRAEGAVVFTQTAEVLAHRNFADALSAARTAWPTFFGIADRNGNRVLDAAEIADSPRGALVRARDRDGDGRVRPEELYRRVQAPETTYDRQRTIRLGGKSVELVHVGDVRVPDMTALYFPVERIVFVDEPPIDGTRLSPGSDSPRELLRWLDTIGQLDFDLGMSGDGQTFSAATVHELRAYLADIVEGVTAGRTAGLSLAEVQALPFLTQYASKPFAVDRARDVEAVYRSVRVMHVEMAAAAVANYASLVDGYCEGFTSCSGSKPVALGSVGLSVSGLRMGVSSEFSAGDQSWHVHTGPYFDQEFAVRQARGAVLFRYHSVRPRFVSALVGGMSVTKTSIKGASRVKESFARSGGARPFGSELSTKGLTAGVDLAPRIAGRVDLIIPIRVTRLLGENSPLLPSRTDFQAGVGLTYGFARRVR